MYKELFMIYWRSLHVNYQQLNFQLLIINCQFY